MAGIKIQHLYIRDQMLNLNKNIASIFFPTFWWVFLYCDKSFIKIRRSTIQGYILIVFKFLNDNWKFSVSIKFIIIIINTEKAFK